MAFVGNSALSAIKDWVASKFAALVHTHTTSQITDFTTEMAKKADATHGHEIGDVNGLQTALDGKASKADVLGAMQIKGSVENYAALPESPNKNDAYQVLAASPDYGIAAGEFVMWDGEAWQDMGGTVDLSNYYNKGEIDQKFEESAPNEHTHEIGDVNGLQTALDGKANASDVYTKNETDGKLNTKANSSDVYTKTETYTKTEVDGKIPVEMTAEEALAILNGTTE